MKKYFLVLFIILSVTFIVFITTKDTGQTLIIKKVIDGDTILLSNDEKVRLIGIDTPEIYDNNKLNYDIKRLGVSKKVLKKAGKVSKIFVKKIAEGRKAKLVFGPEKIDKYGRTLAFIYLILSCSEYEKITDKKTNDPNNANCTKELFLNKEIIKRGYAEVFRKYDFRFKDLFLYYEREAKNKNLGIWAHLLPH